MNYQRNHLLLLPFIFSLLFSLFATVSAQPICLNNGNYTSNSTYQSNLRALFSNLSANIDQNGFYSASVGENTNRANGVALCRGDVQLDFCRSCIQNATVDLVQACPNQRQAVFWHEFCMLRYSNASITGTVVAFPAYHWWNRQNSTSPDQFMSDLRLLLDNTSSQASSGGSLRKVGYGNISTVGFQTIYALEQCTPDLSADNCLSCLRSAAQVLPRQFYGLIGARILQTNCNLRYEITRFYNETRLREFVLPVPTPPVPSQAEPPEQGSGSNDNDTTRTIIIVAVSIIGFGGVVVVVILIGVLRWRMKNKPHYNK